MHSKRFARFCFMCVVCGKVFICYITSFSFPFNKCVTSRKTSIFSLCCRCVKMQRLLRFVSNMVQVKINVKMSKLKVQVTWITSKHVSVSTLCKQNKRNVYDMVILIHTHNNRPDTNVYNTRSKHNTYTKR